MASDSMPGTANDPTVDPANLPRRAVCIGVPTFAGDASATYSDLPFVDDRVPMVAAAMRRFGYRVTTVTAASLLTGAELPMVVQREARELGPDGILLVHVISHGHMTPDGALYVVGSDGQYEPDGHIDEWVRRFEHFPQLPRTLFLLDLCESGNAARQLWHLKTATDRCWVLAACAAGQSAFEGRFSQAVANVLNAMSTGGAHIDATMPYIPLAVVAMAVRREVNRLVDRSDGFAQEVTGSLRDIAADPLDVPLFPNLRYQADATRVVRPALSAPLLTFLEDIDEALDPVHFMGRVSGRPDQTGDPGVTGCFSGRKEELHRLTDWCDRRGNAHLVVVTGSPGAGKSALIGIIVCAAHPRLSEPTKRLWRHVAWHPGINTRLVAVHARQRDLMEIITSFAVQLALDPPHDPAGWTPASFINELATLDESPTMVLDALDEAHRFQQIMERLLLPLTDSRRADGTPTCRLLVGMRPWPELRPLREAAEAGGSLIDLDTVDQRQLTFDIRMYVSELLWHHPPYETSDYAAFNGAFAAHLADRLTGEAAGRQGPLGRVPGRWHVHPPRGDDTSARDRDRPRQELGSASTHPPA